MNRQPAADANETRPPANANAESAYAWLRMLAALTLSTIGGVGMWSVVVVLPAVQAEFGVSRADASLPYTLTMICFGLAGIGMGRLSDRFGIVVPLVVGAGARLVGCLVAASATSMWQFALAQGVLIGGADLQDYFRRQDRGFGKIGRAADIDGRPVDFEKVPDIIPENRLVLLALKPADPHPG